MSIVLLVMTDGRDDYLERTLDSAGEWLHGPISRILVHDDTGDADHRAGLISVLQGHHNPVPVDVVGRDVRLGFGGAIENAWSHLRATAEQDDARFVFHLEGDFTFARKIELGVIGAVLDAHPQLAQVALRRQAWNTNEREAGGVVELHPDWYQDAGSAWLPFLEHRVCFTTNPCLYRRSLTWQGWPTCAHSEGIFTHQLLDQGATFAYWGARDSGEWCHHIGEKRAGSGY